MPWILNHKHKIEEKSTKSSWFSSKFIGLGLADWHEFPTLHPNALSIFVPMSAYHWQDPLEQFKNFIKIQLLDSRISTCSYHAQFCHHPSPKGECGAQGVEVCCFALDNKWFGELFPYTLTLKRLGNFFSKCNFIF